LGQSPNPQSPIPNPHKQLIFKAIIKVSLNILLKLVNL
jgi:hypothetical protein